MLRCCTMSATPIASIDARSGQAQRSKDRSGRRQNVSNPDKLDFADWFSVVGTAIISGIGGAMAWFNYNKRQLNERMEHMEDQMKTWQEKQATHTTSLAVLQTCQENTERQLEQISETTRDTNENLKELGNTITQILLKVQSN